MIDVAIVGCGVSGLSAAFYLTRKAAGLRIEICDGAERPGGIVSTSFRDGFLLESSADSFVRQKPEAMDLALEAGLEAELVRTPPRHRRTWLWVDNELRPFSPALLMRAPTDVEALTSGGLLSPEGIQRALQEPEAPSANAPDESVAAFFQRRFGEEFQRRLVDPVVSGIYGGRADRLSMRACFPSLFRLERTQGFVSGRSAERPSGSGFMSFRMGMGALIERLCEIVQVRGVQLSLGSRIRGIQRTDDGLRLFDSKGAVSNARFAVVAADAVSAASMLREVDETVAARLDAIPYSSAWIVQFGYRRREFELPDGTGFLAPAGEGRLLTAATWAHQKFPGRCPPDAALIRCFVSGEAWTPGDEDSSNSLVERVQLELAEICGIRQKPDLVQARRWKRTLPLFECGHFQRMEEMRAALRGLPGLLLAGNYIDGVGISDCIRHARAAADAVLAARG